MNKYRVMFLHHASSWTELIEADTPEDALELANNSSAASPSLCCHCSNGLDIDEPGHNAGVFDEDGNEVLCLEVETTNLLRTYPKDFRGEKCPAYSSEWRHVRTGGIYRVATVTNLHGDADRPEQSPMVVYLDEDNRVWSRPLTEWHSRFVEVDDD